MLYIEICHNAYAVLELFPLNAFVNFARPIHGIVIRSRCGWVSPVVQTKHALVIKVLCRHTRLYVFELGRGHEHAGKRDALNRVKQGQVRQKHVIGNGLRERGHRTALALSDQRLVNYRDVARRVFNPREVMLHVQLEVDFAQQRALVLEKTLQKNLLMLLFYGRTHLAAVHVLPVLHAQVRHFHFLVQRLGSHEYCSTSYHLPRVLQVAFLQKECVGIKDGSGAAFLREFESLTNAKNQLARPKAQLILHSLGQVARKVRILRYGLRCHKSH